MNSAVIIIDGDVKAKTRMDVKTNGVHPAIIYEAADQLMRWAATEMVNEAKKVVGNDEKALEKYLDQMLKQLGVGKGNDGPGINNLIKGN
jgi:hypothetical protein